MRFVAGFVLVVLCALAAAPSTADQGAYPKTDEAWNEALQALAWQHDPQGYPIEGANATVYLKSGLALLVGEDARRLNWLINGVEFPETVAALTYATGSAKAIAYVEWHGEGYVTDGDWNDVDAGDLLAQYRDATENSNDERVANGQSALHVVGWVHEPHYDRSSHTVTYAMELESDGQSIANAVALRLGRDGYITVTWAGPIGVFQNVGYPPALLNSALSSYKFDEGHSYADHRNGDKTAGYGLAGLVVAALGLKFGKGLFAGLIALLLAGKKIAIPVVIALGGAFARFRRRLFGTGS